MRRFYVASAAGTRGRPFLTSQYSLPRFDEIPVAWDVVLGLCGFRRLCWRRLSSTNASSTDTSLAGTWAGTCGTDPDHIFCSDPLHHEYAAGPLGSQAFEQ